MLNEANIRYKRVLLKLSGGAVAGSQEVGFDQKSIEHIIDEILLLTDIGIEVAIVIGGGNIFRGALAQSWGIERAEADSIGMVGTLVNSLMLRAALKAKTQNEVRVMSAIRVDAIAEPYIRLRAIHHLEKKIIIIFAGGIGQPYVTTDYPAAQRAIETRCQAMLVAKEGVNGVFTNDPKKDTNAKLYETLGYDDFLHKNLKIMDQSALILAKEHDLPIHIFNFNESAAMKDICLGKNVGTYIAPHTVEKIVL